MSVNEFDPPERFVAGTVGPPGQRTFFLQAREGRRIVTLSLEKQQVSVLAERLVDLLDEVGSAVPAPLGGAEDNAPLDTPIEDDFRVNTLSLAWDHERHVVVIECIDRDPDEAVVADLTGEPEPDDGAAPDLRVVRIVIGPDMARAFARRATAVVSAGRPPCPFCGGPLELEGHICPRSNGYKR